jgi:hypothetical protein
MRGAWATVFLAAVPGAAVSQTPTKAAVSISVTTRDGVPVAGMSVELVPLAGKKVDLITDSLGLASAEGIAVGTAEFTSRKIGFAPGLVRAGLGAGHNTVPIIVDPVAVPIMAEVRILGDREVLSRHQEFETRRLLGLSTASFTETDIHQRNPVDTWQMMRAVPSVLVIADAIGPVYARSTRSDCYMRIMVDGVELRAVPGRPPDLNNLPRPNEIHGIEVFAGPSSIPVQYNTVNGGDKVIEMSVKSEGLSTRVIRGEIKLCGLIAVWTK